MLVGYVSDENYSALCDVAVEFENQQGSVAVHSRASGAIYADVAPGEYTVTLSKPGLGSKIVEMTVDENSPYQFRLLSDRLLGYMWPKWVRSGESAEWRVHSVEQYKLELWRYGLQKELVQNLGWFDDHCPRATMQITPDGDYTQSGVKWNETGYRRKYGAQRLTAPPQSGLYYLHAKTLSGDFFSFPWIVSPLEPKAEIAVLTSNISWNAYNQFGGRSNYFSQNGLASRPTVNSRQQIGRFTQPDSWPYEETSAPLSFDRPNIHSFVPEGEQITDAIRGRTAGAHAPGEWRLLGWMEREGLEYDLYSEVELHFDRVPLERYKVLVLNTHPEYWSKEMYFRVKKWVFEQGGRLINLSGCGLYAEVEFLNESTMVCRREEVWDLRGEPPAALFGVEYTHTGFNSGEPFEVLDASHWAFAETGLKQGDQFGHRTQMERCSGGASALELDKITENSPENLQHLARGMNEGGGGDTVMFETPNGGLVFSSGSLGWPLSLLVDEPISQITQNVFKHFLKSP